MKTLRARAPSGRGKAALFAAGAAAWTVLVLREGRVAQIKEGADVERLTPAKSWVTVLKEAYSGWSAHQVTRLAASLSYYTVFSIAPLLLIATAVIGLVLGNDAASGLIQQQLQGFLGPDKAKAIQSMIAGANKPGAGSAAGVIGFVTLLLGASGVVGELQASLNQIFGVHPIAKSFMQTIRRRLVSLGFVLGLGFLLLVSLGINTGAAAAGKYLGGSMGVPPALIQALNGLVSFGIITLLFAAMFRVLPDARARWKDLSVGAAATSALFTLGNMVLTNYVGKVAGASAYGAAGALLGFLLWTYYCAQIVYFGAEFTRAYAEDRGLGIITLEKS